MLQFNSSLLPQLSNQLRSFPITLPFPRPLFDYLVVEAPNQLIATLRALPGVFSIHSDRPMGIFPTPVNLEVALAQSILNPLNLLRGPQALGVSLPRQDSWPTGESRKAVGADLAEAEGITGKGVKVAVLDTGTDITHPQLLGLRGESMVQGQPLETDENGHGTHVASTVAGAPFNHPFGLLKGVAPGAELIIIKVLGYLIGAGNWSDIMAGMARAQELGAKIISMSLGGDDDPDPDAPQYRVVRQLTEQGVICVIAAGNSGPNTRTVGSPGSAPEALTIGATDKRGALADFSSRGPTLLSYTKPDCTAPGVDILSGSTGLIGAYRFIDGAGRFAAISGTSMATPHASAIIALAEEMARRRGRTLTTPDIKRALAEHYNREPDNEVGYGPLTYPILRRYIWERF